MKVMMLCPTHTKWQDGVLIFEEAIRQGLEVHLCSASGVSQDEILRTFAEVRPDWVFVCGRAWVPVSTLKIISASAEIMVWDSDTLNDERRGQWRNLEGTVSIALSSMVTTAEFCTPYFTKSAWIPSFYDDVYYQVTTSRLSTDVYDVCFIGNTGRDERRVLWCSELSKSFNIRFCGDVTGIVRKPVFASDMADAYANSRIVIDIKRMGFDYGEFDTSDRLFKAMGCGAMYLTYPIPGIERCFGVGKHLDFYDGTYEGLTEKLNYWLSRDIEREQIALRGKEAIYEKHLLSQKIPLYWELMENF
jgi:hypothetical protein